MRYRGFQNVVFDCDSTLSSIEGIDELAEICGKREEIEALTNAAMDGELDLADVYEKRMQLLSPSKEQIVALRQAYKQTVLPGVQDLLAMMASIDVQPWIVSGGLIEAVREFGIWLGIDSRHIFAVDSKYDPLDGSWWRQSGGNDRFMSTTTPQLTQTVGKGAIVADKIRPSSPGRTCLIGDGASDQAASGNVDLFIAFAGVVDRPSVTSSAPVVVPNFEVLTAVVLGPELLSNLSNTEHRSSVLASIEAISRHNADGSFRFNDGELQRCFFSDFDTYLGSK